MDPDGKWIAALALLYVLWASADSRPASASALRAGSDAAEHQIELDTASRRELAAQRMLWDLLNATGATLHLSGAAWCGASLRGEHDDDCAGHKVKPFEAAQCAPQCAQFARNVHDSMDQLARLMWLCERGLATRLLARHQWARVLASLSATSPLYLRCLADVGAQHGQLVCLAGKVDLLERVVRALGADASVARVMFADDVGPH